MLSPNPPFSPECPRNVPELLIRDRAKFKVKDAWKSRCQWIYPSERGTEHMVREAPLGELRIMK